MQITSEVFRENQEIPVEYTCKGKNINPQLSFIDIPKEAKSLVLIMDDPDAPMGTFVHWVLFNISPDTKGIEKKSTPKGAEDGVNGTGKPGYIGPCPPSGTHHYHFKLYALDTILEIKGDSDKQIVETYMKDHIITQAELIGLFSHQ